MLFYSIRPTNRLYKITQTSCKSVSFSIRLKAGTYRLEMRKYHGETIHIWTNL